MSKRATIPTEVELNRRRAKYGRHLRGMGPIRQTTVPEVLAGEPEFRQLAEEREAVRAAELRLDREYRELRARNEHARAVHRDAQREAMLNGTKPPAPLELEVWPYAPNMAAVFEDAHMVLEATESGLLDEHRDRWRALIEGQAAPLRERVRQARAQLARREADLRPWTHAAEELDRLSAATVAADAAGQPLRQRPHDVDEQRAAYLRRAQGGKVAEEILDAFEESRTPPPSRLRGRR